MEPDISTFPAPDGGFMRVARSAGHAPVRGCVLILPGWAEWLEKYTPSQEEWNRRGYDTLVLEWRGQAKSSRFIEDRAKGWTPDFDILVDDLDRFFSDELADAPGPVLIFAHSMGAHLALRWWLETGRRRSSVAGLILLSPMHVLATDPFPLPLAKAIAFTGCALGFSRSYAPGQASYDPATTRFADNRVTGNRESHAAMVATLQAQPELKTGGLTFGWLRAAFRSIARLETLLKRGAPRSAYLVAGGTADQLVRPEGFHAVAAFLLQSTLHLIENAQHELLQESAPQQAELWAAIDAFLKRLPAQKQG